MYDPEFKFTEKQEVAFALLLLKAFRQRSFGRKFGGKVNAVQNTAGHNFGVACVVMDLAAALEVKKEFLELLQELPVLTGRFVFKEEEEWDKSSWVYAALSPPTAGDETEQFKRSHKKKPFSANPKPKSEETLLAAEILQSVAQAVQHRVHSRVAGVVSRCLRAVFGNGAYDFRIEFEKKRGRTEARPLFRRNGYDVEPLDGVGGGVLDVTSFALRVVCLVLKRPARRKFLVLDEPFKHLSSRYQPRAAELIQSLSEEFGIQILLVTHNPAFEIGKVIEVKAATPR